VLDFRKADRWWALIPPGTDASSPELQDRENRARLPRPHCLGPMPHKGSERSHRQHQDHLSRYRPLRRVRRYPGRWSQFRDQFRRPRSVLRTRAIIALPTTDKIIVTMTASTCETKSVLSNLSVRPIFGRTLHAESENRRESAEAF
jgi:hypothetical protein